MSQVKLIEEKKNEWTPWVEIKLSKSEAARLVAYLGGAIGHYRPNSDLYCQLSDAFNNKNFSTKIVFDTNDYSQEAKRWIDSQGGI